MASGKWNIDWSRALRIQGYLGCALSQDLIVFLMLRYVYAVEIVTVLLARLCFACSLQRDLLAALTGS